MAVIPNGFEGQMPKGLELLNMGKVRNTFVLPDHPDKLLMVATDRISIYDFVLPAFVGQKGAILTAMNVFWRQFYGDQFRHDLVAHGAAIDEFLPEALRRNRELQAVATVIQKYGMIPVEAIVRGYLTGSSVKPYLSNGVVCGHRLPRGLHDGYELPYPLFTPTTKASVGHDEHISADSVAQEYGVWLERLALQAYMMARQYAIGRGIILVDTKFEMAKSILADELLTPDSSRYWGHQAWVEAQKNGELPPSFDKQYVREWGKTVGIDKLTDPDDPNQIATVHGLTVPQDVLDMTTKIYRYIFWRLVGQKLEHFQKDVMGIDREMPKVNVDIVLGSQSDFTKLVDLFNYGDHIASWHPFAAFFKNVKSHRIHIISCHRNPDELRQYAESLSDVDVIVAGAGLAAQLPGVLKAWLDHYGKSVPVIGVGFPGPNEEANTAACLSIEQLPGQPVELNGEGKAYFGKEGFKAALIQAVLGEFLPKKNVPKPAELNVLFSLEQFS